MATIQSSTTPLIPCASRHNGVTKGGKALERTAGVGGRGGRHPSTPPRGKTMPDTLATFESNSIPSSRANGVVNGHRANPKASKAPRPRDTAKSAGNRCEVIELRRQLRIAEEKLNARIDCSDASLETAYFEAQDHFVDCKVTSLEGVLSKLLLIDEIEDLDAQLKDAPRLVYLRVLKSLIRDLKAQVGSVGVAPQPAQQCARGSRPAQDSQAAAVIDARMNDVMMAAYGAQNLASLLEMVSGDGFKEASARDNYWHKRWWGQAEYISRTLERLGDELQANGEAIETALADIKYGRAPT
jgi:hypothetical protein